MTKKKKQMLNQKQNTNPASARGSHLSQAGFGIIEVMVAAGLLLIIAIGISALITNMQKEQRRQQLLATFSLMQNQMQNLIKNENSWKSTLDDAASNPNMECLRRGLRCDGSAVPGNYVNAAPDSQFVNNAASEIILKDGSGNIFYDGRVGSNTRAFTEGGSPCTGFTYNAPGNDLCPIGYIINWRATSADITPQIIVSAKMIYNPTDANPFKKFVNALPLASMPSPYVYQKYDTRILRTAKAMTKAFTVTVPFNRTGTGCLDAGYGNCGTGGYVYTGYSDSPANFGYDPFDLVDTTALNIAFKQKGSYKCTANTNAFAVNSVRAEIVVMPTNARITQMSSASAFGYGYANIVTEGLVEINADTGYTLTIQQTCQVAPSAAGYGAGTGFQAPNIDNCTLGFVSGTSYGAPNPFIKASITCSKIE